METTNKTQIYNLVILDKSGSMQSIADAAIAGFNETVSGIRQAQEKFKDTQEHFVSLMAFCNCEKKMIYDKIPIDKVSTLTSKEYMPCCCTPLYDAMGLALNNLRNDIKDKENATAVVTIITDGMENASREFTGSQIKALVEELTEKEGWQFAYIGTNQDVKQVSAKLSISNSMSFVDDNEGMRNAWRSERSSKMRMYDRLNDEMDVCRNMEMNERKLFRAKSNKMNSFFIKKDHIAHRITPEYISELAPNEVFVFGSNIDGSHASGAAAFAVRNFGAVVGQAKGLQGQSYAIPTVGVSIQDIYYEVEQFLNYAWKNPQKKFLVTRIGCGHGLFTEEEIAPCFVYAIKHDNVSLPLSFWEYIL